MADDVRDDGGDRSEDDKFLGMHAIGVRRTSVLLCLMIHSYRPLPWPLHICSKSCAPEELMLVAPFIYTLANEESG